MMRTTLRTMALSIAAVSDRAQVLVTGANAAIKSNNGAPFVTAKFVSVSKSINSYCGQKADGSPA